jgi:uncharacterized protein
MASIFAVPFLSVLVLLAASRVAMAADIDCHAVKTPLTEIICDDAELLQLDSRMADRLAAAMDAAGNDRAALAR